MAELARDTRALEVPCSYALIDTPGDRRLCRICTQAGASQLTLGGLENVGLE